MLLATTACGRIEFDVLADARVVDGITADTTLVTCDLDAPFTRVTEIPELGSLVGDGGLRLSRDELTAYMHSDRAPYAPTYGFLTSTRPSIGAPFEPPVVMNQTGFFSYETRDGLALVWDDSDDMYMVTRASTAVPYDFSQAQTLLSSGNSDQHAYVSADQTQLYYALDFALMVTDFPPTGPGTPIAELNTTGTERRPVVSDDGLALYFGRMTLNENVFVSRRASTADAWGTPTELTEVTFVTEVTGPTWLSPDNCRLYLESTRPVGDYGHWVAERDPN